jgi:ribosomal protein S18 acetylase RimI-like enzyme
VPRIPVHARAAVVEDVPLLVGLWGELRHVGARTERAVTPLSITDVSACLIEAIDSDDCRVVIALDGDEAAGMAVLRDHRPDPLAAHRVVQMSHVVVAPGKRRRGVGHALVAAAADFADERQLEHVVSGVYPSMRDASRFYARLGFAPVLVQRVAPVAVLRRRLGNGYAPAFGVLRRPVPIQRVRARLGERAD